MYTHCITISSKLRNHIFYPTTHSWFSALAKLNKQLALQSGTSRISTFLNYDPITQVYMNTGQNGYPFVLTRMNCVTQEGVLGNAERRHAAHIFPLGS